MPAFQSLPSRPNASRLKLASKVTHGEDMTLRVASSKRETKVGRLNMTKGRAVRILLGYSKEIRELQGWVSLVAWVD